MEAPIKCQVCPYFEFDYFNEVYECSAGWCKLKTDESLRKQVYKTIKNLKGEK